MTNKKVYCSNCVYLSDEGVVGSPRHYGSIRFRTDLNKRIDHGTSICTYGMEKKIERIDGPLHPITKLVVTVDDPLIMNENNSCVMYKEKLCPKIVTMLRKTLNIK